MAPHPYTCLRPCTGVRERERERERERPKMKGIAFQPPGFLCFVSESDMTLPSLCCCCCSFDDDDNPEGMICKHFMLQNDQDDELADCCLLTSRAIFTVFLI